MQIVHVHGSYWFYDCCNLRDEIEDRAVTSPPMSASVGGLLQGLLVYRSPLVIGYSGWEGDVIMSALRRRLSGGPLPYNLYWFCFRRAQVESAPEWLKNHSQVRFVVPGEERPEPVPTDELESSDTRAREVLTPEKQAPPGKAKGDPTLNATQVLEELIRSFNLKAPPLTQDPLAFFADSLRNLLPQDDEPRGERDLYFIGKVIKRLERAREREERVGTAESCLDRVRDNLRRSQFREAIRVAMAVQLHDLDDSQVGELLEATMEAALGLLDDSVEELEGYKLVARIGEIATSRGIASISMYEQVARALRYEGLTLGTLNRSEEAIATYDEMVWRFGEAAEPGVREQVARALFNKGFRLGTLNRNDEAIATYDEVVRRFGEATEPGVREQVAKALVNKGVTLGTLNRSDEEIATYHEVVRRFGEATEPGLIEQVNKARELLAGSSR